jgi:predicted PurR-regulated permease PerM
LAQFAQDIDAVHLGHAVIEQDQIGIEPGDLFQRLLNGAAFWLTGAPYSALWGVVTAFAALVPLGGTTMVTVPASLYLFLQGENIRGIILFVWCLGVVVAIDKVLRPIFIGSRIQMPTIFLLFGILGGLAVFGALGLILGPVLFALLAALIDLYDEEHRISRKE